MRLSSVASLLILLAAVTIAVPLDSKTAADPNTNIDSNSKTLITNRQGLFLGSLSVVGPLLTEIVGPPPFEDE
ncbi:uncharacterized protein ASPGLDRAFT_42013 [Aspergillus glaucus CBS 516.65]|uniref:Uncharacterized protein n=1 Tax=Aspergillus glaucus CBS 516.65 TaxID=1160497 RepID=A0A1L9VX00_ASPGL|nr:hypothetical protein ASPGLDRAFT_42013 [Aspergillus glaucus CBS 516.65]OJJ88443.1 hypothetical protein ASPGLDRAFT_42013 [Aspergillus glaucus CBS 516.65]